MDGVAAKESLDKPRYRMSFETSADSPEELHRRISKSLRRHIKRRKGRKLGR